jgi:hypothetical protein
MIRYCILLLAIGLAGFGCGKKEAEKPAASGAKQSVSVESAGSDQPPPPPGPAGAAAESAEVPDAPAGPAATDPVIAAYNAELSAWILSRDYVPTDLNDLKNKQGLPPLPKAPPGKKIVYKPNVNLPTQSKIVLE